MPLKKKTMCNVYSPSRSPANRNELKSVNYENDKSTLIHVGPGGMIRDSILEIYDLHPM